MRRVARKCLLVLMSLTILGFVPGPVGSAFAEPEIHKKIAPLAPWMDAVDDPARADTAWTGLGAALPMFADSVQRGFGWYLMFSAARTLGHVDSMRVAAESSFVYSPNDVSGFRELAQYLARAQHHLDLALECALRVRNVKHQAILEAVEMEDLRWLGYIQLKLGQDSAAIATFEERVKRDASLNSWTLYRLGRLYARTQRPDLAIDRLSLGLSSIGQDPADSAQAISMLDSLVAAQGQSPAAAHARITEGRAVATRRFWLEAWRDGSPAPKATLVDLHGARAPSPREDKGITVVYAWATWCGPCRKSLPALQAWSARPRTKPVRVVTVNAEGEPLEQASTKVTEFFATKDIRLPALFADSAATAGWKLGSFPMTLVLQDGRIVYRNHAGDLVSGLEAQLASLGSHPKD